MIVYHGSTLQIVHPDIAHSKRYLDFGRGFYVTSFQPQAEKMGIAERDAFEHDCCCKCI